MGKKTTTTNAADSSRSATITIGGQDYELVLTTRATRLIAQRYGGLEHLGDALETSEDVDKSLGEVIWLITLLANQSVQIHNLTHTDDQRTELTEDAVELLTVPADLAAIGQQSAKHYSEEQDARLRPRLWPQKTKPRTSPR